MLPDVPPPGLVPMEPLVPPVDPPPIAPPEVLGVLPMPEPGVPLAPPGEVVVLLDEPGLVPVSEVDDFGAAGAFLS